MSDLADDLTNLHASDADWLRWLRQSEHENTRISHQNFNAGFNVGRDAAIITIAEHKTDHASLLNIAEGVLDPDSNVSPLVLRSVIAQLITALNDENVQNNSLTH